MSACGFQQTLAVWTCGPHLPTYHRAGQSHPPAADSFPSQTEASAPASHCQNLERPSQTYAQYHETMSGVVMSAIVVQCYIPARTIRSVWMHCCNQSRSCASSSLPHQSHATQPAIAITIKHGLSCRRRQNYATVVWLYLKLFLIKHGDDGKRKDFGETVEQCLHLGLHTTGQPPLRHQPKMPQQSQPQPLITITSLQLLFSARFDRSNLMYSSLFSSVT
jgi:hypothetical protein